MKRGPLVSMLGAAAVGILLLPVMATHSTAAAAHLKVTASPIQTWTIVDALPALPVQDVTAEDGAGELTDPSPVGSELAQDTQVEGGTAGEVGSPPGSGAAVEDPSPPPVPAEDQSPPPVPAEDPSPLPVPAAEDEPVSDPAPAQEVERVADPISSATADAGPP